MKDRDVEMFEPTLREYERQRAELVHNGYVDIDETRSGIKVGDRVCHCGERYYEAMADGTAVVLCVMRNKGSFWERKYGQPDVELLVARDRPMFEGDHFLVSGWADYHTRRLVRVA